MCEAALRRESRGVKAHDPLSKRRGVISMFEPFRDIQLGMVQFWDLETILSLANQYMQQLMIEKLENSYNSYNSSFGPQVGHASCKFTKIWARTARQVAQPEQQNMQNEGHVIALGRHRNMRRKSPLFDVKECNWRHRCRKSLDMTITGTVRFFIASMNFRHVLMSLRGGI